MPAVDVDADVHRLREALRNLPLPFMIHQYEATEEDYEELADEDLRCEYLDGVLIVHSPATLRHEERIVFLATLLNIWAAERRLGRVFGSNAVMQLGIRRFCPDLTFLAAGHADRIRGERIVGPVDLLIETISTSTRRYDLGEKRAAYRDGRIPEIWLLDPDRRECHVDVLEGQTYASRTLDAGRLSSSVLPGFSIDVSWLWSDPLPNPIECLKSM